MPTQCFHLNTVRTRELAQLIEENPNMTKSEILSKIVCDYLDTRKAILRERPERPKIEKPETPERQFTQWICVRGKPRHPNPQMQKAQCEACKANHWKEWKACQDLRAERG